MIESVSGLPAAVAGGARRGLLRRSPRGLRWLLRST